MNDMNNTVGTVCLIGAGPGAADLISVRGLERLRRAEVLLYDRLAGGELLNEVPDACEKINVGKRVGAHAMKQEEINRLLVEKALTGKYVVRLKGGDAFVFGRGGEEILALREAGIPYELVPGISSCIAVPELAGLPVTHRETARSFHVITGHTAHEEKRDYAQYAGLSGTLIFLMGIGSLEEIVKGLLSGGMEADTPVSIIENGALPDQRRVDGTLSDITETAFHAHVQPPAIIVVGACAAFHMLYEGAEGAAWSASEQRSPHIGVTGSAHMVHKICGLLEAEGLFSQGFATMQVCKTNALSQKSIDWAAIDWIVFTSSNGVEQFFSQLAALCIDRRLLADVKYAVVGQGMAKKLSKYGLSADFIPTQPCAKALGRELAEKISSCTVAVFQAEHADADLGEELAVNTSLNICIYPIYRLAADGEQTARFWNTFSHMDYVICTSAEGVRFLKRPLPCKNTPAFLCIGAKTEAALKEWLADTDIPVLRTSVNTAEGLVTALLDMMNQPAVNHKAVSPGKSGF